MPKYNGPAVSWHVKHARAANRMAVFYKRMGQPLAADGLFYIAAKHVQLAREVRDEQ